MTMIKEEFLKPFKLKKCETMFNISPDVCIFFLRSMSKEQISKLGNSLRVLFPRKPINYQRQFSNNKDFCDNWDFVNEFRKEYNISNKYTLKDKGIGLKLASSLYKNPKMTATEFIEKYNI